MTLQAKSQNAESNLASGTGSFIFWQRWLLVAADLLILFGIVMTFLNNTVLFSLFNTQINPIFWGTAEMPTAAAQFQGWIYGVAGAILIGWGIFMAFIAYYPFKQREKWAWNCILTGMLVWYLIDTFISLQFNVVFNAISNTVFLIIFLLPLIFTRKDFQ
jgi:hypothetical protein